MNERDTHFQGFAKLLFEELYSYDGVYFDTADEHWRENWQEIIAQRAYDLAFHVIETVSYPHLRTVPDITQWPDYSIYPDLPVDHS